MAQTKRSTVNPSPRRRKKDHEFLSSSITLNVNIPFYYANVTLRSNIATLIEGLTHTARAIVAHVAMKQQ